MCVCVSAETLGKTELKKREGHFLYSDSGNGINTPSENVRSCGWFRITLQILKNILLSLSLLKSPNYNMAGWASDSTVEVSILSSKTIEKATMHAVKTPMRLGFRQSVIETLPFTSYVILSRFLNHWKLQLPDKRKKVYKDSSVFWNRYTTFAKFSVNPRMAYIYSYNIYIFS